MDDWNMNTKDIGRKRYENGNAIGKINMNTFIDSKAYTIEFDNGEICEYDGIFITENMYEKSNCEGKKYLIMSDIVDHHSNDSTLRK